MIFNCVYCNYKTDKKHSFLTHEKSEKHNRNKKEYLKKYKKIPENQSKPFQKRTKKVSPIKNNKKNSNLNPVKKKDLKDSHLHSHIGDTSKIDNINHFNGSNYINPDKKKNQKISKIKSNISQKSDMCSESDDDTYININQNLDQNIELNINDINVYNNSFELESEENKNESEKRLISFKNIDVFYRTVVESFEQQVSLFFEMDFFKLDDDQEESMDYLRKKYQLLDKDLRNEILRDVKILLITSVFQNIQKNQIDLIRDNKLKLKPIHEF